MDIYKDRQKTNFTLVSHQFSYSKLLISYSRLRFQDFGFREVPRELPASK